MSWGCREALDGTATRHRFGWRFGWCCLCSGRYRTPGPPEPPETRSAKAPLPRELGTCKTVTARLWPSRTRAPQQLGAKRSAPPLRTNPAGPFAESVNRKEPLVCSRRREAPPGARRVTCDCTNGSQVEATLAFMNGHRNLFSVGCIYSRCQEGAAPGPRRSTLPPPPPPFSLSRENRLRALCPTRPHTVG